MGSNFNIAEALDKIENDVDREEWSLWGGQQPGNQNTDLFQSPKFQDIVQLLMQSPILVAPTLNWIRKKQAQIAQAQLQTLYTQEELEEMYKQVENES